jgi:hypothetical protein
MSGRSVTPNHLHKPAKLTADVAQAVDDYRRALVAERAAVRELEKAPAASVNLVALARARKVKEQAAFARLDARKALDDVLLGEET